MMHSAAKVSVAVGEFCQRRRARLLFIPCVVAIAMSDLHAVGCGDDPCPPGPTDCDENGQDDICEIENNPSLDCNLNGQLDSCDIASGLSQDSDGNGTPDDCDIPIGVYSFIDKQGREIGEASFSVLDAYLSSVRVQLNDIVLRLEACPDAEAEYERDRHGRVLWSSAANWKADLIEKYNRLYFLEVQLSQVVTNLMAHRHQNRVAIVNNLKSAGPSNDAFLVEAEQLEIGPWTVEDVRFDGLGDFEVTLNVDETFLLDRPVQLRQLKLENGASIQTGLHAFSLSDNVIEFSFLSDTRFVNIWGDTNMAAVDEDGDGTQDYATVAGPGEMEIYEAIARIQGFIDDMRIQSVSAQLTGDALVRIASGADGGKIIGDSTVEWSFENDGTLEWSGGVLTGNSQSSALPGFGKPDIENCGLLIVGSDTDKLLLNGILLNMGATLVEHDDLFELRASHGSSLARIENATSGTMTFSADGMWRPSPAGGTGVIEIINNGTMIRDGSGGTHTIQSIPVSNSSLIECRSGEFALRGGCSLINGTLRADGGSILVAEGNCFWNNATLDVAELDSIHVDATGAAFQLDGSVCVTGDGIAEISPGAQGCIVDGSAATISNVGAALTLFNGRLNVPADSSLNILASEDSRSGCVSLDRLEMVGEGAKQLHGHVRWIDGTMEGTIATGTDALIELRGAPQAVFEHQINHACFENHGTMHDDGARRLLLRADSGETTTLWNAPEGTIEWTGPTWLTANPGGSGGSERFVNDGILRKSRSSDLSQIGASVEWINRGDVFIEQGSIRAHGNVQLQSGAIVLFQNTATFRCEQLEHEGGRLAGIGSIDADVNSTGGCIDPGVNEIDSPIGTLRILRNMTLSADTELTVDIGGTRPEQSDLLQGSQQCNLGSAIIRVRLQDGFIPKNADEWVILEAAWGRTGTFGKAILPVLPAGLAWDIVYRSDSVTVRVISAGLLGDINGDGAVDIDDLLLLLATWGPCEQCPADIDGDGDVDTDDLLALLAHWGA